MKDGSPERAQLALKIIYQLLKDREKNGKHKLSEDDFLCIKLWCASGLGVLNQIVTTEERTISEDFMITHARETTNIIKGG